MFKWLGRLRWWRSKGTGPIVYEYGRYLHKPVTARAILMVMDIQQSTLTRLIDQKDIYLNDEPVGYDNPRLESGGYEIKIPSQNKVWRFFIG